MNTGITFLKKNVSKHIDFDSTSNENRKMASLINKNKPNQD